MNRREPGFSLVELMITLIVFALVVGAVMVVMATSTRSKQSTEGLIEAQQSARATLEIMTRDIRSAGFGVDKDAVPAQPAFAYVDSQEIMIYANEQPAPLVWNAATNAYVPPLPNTYNSAGSQSIPDTSSIQAPSPSGTPLPPKLAGSYALTTKWNTGAELVRYTLDVNDDGAIDGSDQNAAIATDVQRTMNPNDYLLVRRVYGDKSGSVPTLGNNGGTIEKVGLVRKPGNGVAPMFTVYIGSNPLPWNWANGPIPPTSLNKISRVTVNVTAEARSPNKGGVYSQALMSTEVNSLRNVPESGQTLYTVDGYVYNDKDMSLSRNTGDVGLANVVLRLGTAGVGLTNASGYYNIQVPPGQYMLRQSVPPGYGAFAADSFGVNFVSNPVSVSHDFADTARQGGWLSDTVFVDEDFDLVRDPGESGMSGATISVGGQSAGTDVTGAVKFFLTPGSYAVSCTAPDSFTVASTNPVAITMTNGGTARADFAVVLGGTATVRGMVYRDSNKNGSYDTGEVGVANVWVAVTKNSGIDVLGYVYTDASGNYSVVVPNNDPPHTTPYQITYQLPTNTYATSTTIINNLWLTAGQIVTGKNFGVNNFQIITLTADRVLSLCSSELMEKDWTGNDDQYDAKAHKDTDLILGSEWVSNPNISVWFNDWNASTLFASMPTYQRNAQASALSMAVGTLDGGTEPRRPDVVTGLKSYTFGNIAVWLTQNTSGNFGYLPALPAYYRTVDNGDVNSLLLASCDGNSSQDLIVGTRTTDNTGTIEIWLNTGLGVFGRSETYPTGGGFSAGGLGQVKALQMADLDGDGDQDLVVTTRTNYLAGKLHVIERIGNVAGSRFSLKRTYDLSGEGNAAVLTDVDGDGRLDIVVGTHTNTSSGKIEYWHNDGSLDFSAYRIVNAPGIVLSLGTADYGGLSRNDLALGYQDSETSNGGGVRIYILDSGTLPSSGVDPSGGSGANYMTPALTVNNFNNGENPSGTGIQFSDLAVAQKPTPTTGQVVIFLR